MSFNPFVPTNNGLHATTRHRRKEKRKEERVTTVDTANRCLTGKGKSFPGGFPFLFSFYFFLFFILIFPSLPSHPFFRTPPTNAYVIMPILKTHLTLSQSVILEFLCISFFSLWLIPRRWLRVCVPHTIRTPGLEKRDGRREQKKSKKIKQMGSGKNIPPLTCAILSAS